MDEKLKHDSDPVISAFLSGRSDVSTTEVLNGCFVARPEGWSSIDHRIVATYIRAAGYTQYRQRVKGAHVVRWRLPLRFYNERVFAKMPLTMADKPMEEN